MLIEILVTSERALGDRPSPRWVADVLEVYPLDSTIHFFTRILHAIELAPDPIGAALRILPTITEDCTRSGVREEAERIQARGRRPAVFSRLLLLDILKEAICRCGTISGNLTLSNKDQLFRAYLATHDHFQPVLSARGRSKEEQLKEDIFRQALTGPDQVPLAVPRYWSLWVTIPKRLGLADRLAMFLPSGMPRPMSSSIVPMASLWAFFANQSNIHNALPAALDERGWEPTVLAQLRSLISEITLDADVYKQRLQEERTNLGPGERWEYAMVTPSRTPLLRIGDKLSCISLALLANTFCDGLYHRMLTACGRDGAKVIEFTSIFGEVFHEYVYDLWQRIAGFHRTHKLIWGRGQDELGDGVVETASGLIVYDAKSRRPTLNVTRSGDFDAFFDDLELGVLKGARQLDAAIEKLRLGGLARLVGANVEKIFPIIVTARNFPEVPFVYERIDRILRDEGLLQGQDVAPLLVIDVQTLEILEGLKESADDVVTLLTQKALSPDLRTRTLDIQLFAERGNLPWPTRMRNAFGRIGDCMLNWFRSGQIDEEVVDRVLYPSDREAE